MQVITHFIFVACSISKFNIQINQLKNEKKFEQRKQQQQK